MARSSARDEVRRLLLANPAISGAALARMLGISRQRVSQIAKAEGLTLRPDSGTLEETFGTLPGPARQVAEPHPLGRVLARADKTFSEQRRAVVYALVDERSPTIVRYVGSTVDPGPRLRGHWLSGPPRLRAWIASVLAAGAIVELRQIGESHGDRSSAYMAEEAQIDRFQAMGQADLNIAKNCGA